MRQATETMLVHLLAAMDAKRAVTIRYTKPVKGGVEVTRRRIEIHAIEVDGKGDILVRCFDQRSQSDHTFRLDRITHYTLHRAPRLAWYTQPTAATPAVFGSVDPTTGDEDAVTGFRAWSLVYVLAA